MTTLLWIFFVCFIIGFSLFFNMMRLVGKISQFRQNAIAQIDAEKPDPKDMVRRFWEIYDTDPEQRRNAYWTGINLIGTLVCVIVGTVSITFAALAQSPLFTQ